MINTNEILSQYDIRLTKSLGQNFLTDANIIRKITEAGELTQEDLVIEVGPGIGALTVSLAQQAGKVIAVEIDKNLIPALKDTTGPFTNVTIIHEDILKVDIQSILQGWNGKVKIISNLPYYVTTPVVMMFLESNFPIERMVLMVQKEVALRMAAKPGTKDYGALSVGVQVAGTSKVLFQVSKNCFIPKPDVDSAVLRILLNDQLLRQIKDKTVFFNCVRAAFSQRRKTLLNAMSGAPNWRLDKEAVKWLIDTMGLKEMIRGEELSVEQFITMSNLVVQGTNT
ncbi:MAG: 16S rRNA (adenine(1518)-N(6)/adenine(1519)-N(6))-dimethyltransferase RsmA [Thermoclostridium sp.]|nr:16S rRNA (adenine(1518)-N(6)/adenine(1519)-N(6))-dimethyltransferase RsmA [Thermoclostridium sp.]